MRQIVVHRNVQPTVGPDFNIFQPHHLLQYSGSPEFSVKIGHGITLPVYLSFWLNCNPKGFSRFHSSRTYKVLNFGSTYICRSTGNQWRSFISGWKKLILYVYSEQKVTKTQLSPTLCYLYALTFLINFFLSILSQRLQWT